MTDIIPAISLGAFKATPTGLQLPKSKVPIERWMEYGVGIMEVRGALRWCIGDWLNYGEERYGDMYTQGYTLFKEYEESSVRHMRRVAEAFPLVRRRTGVSWSAHAEIANRPKEEQEQWLDELEMGMTRAELRRSLNSSPDLEKHACPLCGKEHIVG